MNPHRRAGGALDIHVLAVRATHGVGERLQQRGAAGAAPALEDTAIINSARERLQTASHKLAEAMYKAAGPAAGAAPGGDANAQAGSTNGEKKDEGVIDAEYVDVDEKK